MPFPNGTAGKNLIAINYHLLMHKSTNTIEVVTNMLRLQSKKGEKDCKELSCLTAIKYFFDMISMILPLVRKWAGICLVRHANAVVKKISISWLESYNIEKWRLYTHGRASLFCNN